MDASDATATVDGHEIHYHVAGPEDAPTLLLLHGGIIDAAHVTWGGLVDPLAGEYRVLAPDLLGYGASDKPDGPYPVARHVETVAGFLEAVDAGPVTPVGLSLGGGVGLGLALEHPGLVERLVLFDAYGLGSELSNGALTYLLARTQVQNRLAIALFRRSRSLTRASLSGIVHDVDALSADAVDAVWEETKRPGVGTGFRGFRAAEVTRDGYRTTFTDRLGDLSVPALVCHGQHDEVFPPAWSERAAAAIPDAAFEPIADAAHWAPRERPERVRTLVTDFVG